MSERAITVDLAREAGLPVYRFPKTSEESAIAEDALARALNKLSLDEQEKIIFDVHGIKTSKPFEDDGDSLCAFLNQLEIEIGKLTKKDAFDQAGIEMPEPIYRVHLRQQSEASPPSQERPRHRDNYPILE